MGSGPEFDVLCIALGGNDLLKVGTPTVEETYPDGLDDDLLRLVAAVKSKAPLSLFLFGGPSSLWKYPPRWDFFVQHIHDFLVSQCVAVVPPNAAARVMLQMPLQDGLHFANDEETKMFFAQAWAEWLLCFAGMEQRIR